ncbi:hypothetical protein AGMMS49592_5630 [Endomicrobiia bacterium]|nr:hypothetical protein AGMMS49592_5630 [Endomicrobiia bacterium]
MVMYLYDTDGKLVATNCQNFGLIGNCPDCRNCDKTLMTQCFSKYTYSQLNSIIPMKMVEDKNTGKTYNLCEFCSNNIDHDLFECDYTQNCILEFYGKEKD